MDDDAWGDPRRADVSGIRRDAVILDAGRRSAYDWHEERCHPPPTRGRPMPHRPWIQHYVTGTHPEIPPIPYKHLPDMVRYVAEQFGPRRAFTQCMPNGMDASLTYARGDRLSDHFAAYLREVAGLQPGDRVAVQLPNCLTYPIAAFGVLKAGCI